MQRGSFFGILSSHVEALFAESLAVRLWCRLAVPPNERASLAWVLKYLRSEKNGGRGGVMARFSSSLLHPDLESSLTLP